MAQNGCCGLPCLKHSIRVIASLTILSSVFALYFSFTLSTTAPGEHGKAKSHKLSRDTQDALRIVNFVTNALFGLAGIVLLLQMFTIFDDPAAENAKKRRNWLFIWVGSTVIEILWGTGCILCYLGNVGFPFKFIELVIVGVSSTVWISFIPVVMIFYYQLGKYVQQTDVLYHSLQYENTFRYVFTVQNSATMSADRS